MVRINTAQTAEFKTTWPELEIDGIGVDPDLISVQRLDENTGVNPSLLYLSVKKPFDDISWFEWGAEVTLKVGGVTRFIGILVAHELRYSMFEEGINLVVPDLTWLINSGYVEFDNYGLSVQELLHSILPGEDVEEDAPFDPPVDPEIVTLGSDPGILPSRYQDWQLAGMPVYDALVHAVEQCGNFICWIDYEDCGTDPWTGTGGGGASSKCVFMFQKRHTGSERKVIVGENDGSSSTKANLIQLNGGYSAKNLVNRYVGRGDRITMESTSHGFRDKPVEVLADWDEDKNSTVLANPAYGENYRSYSSVGTRYRIQSEDIEAGGLLGQLVSVAKHTANRIQEAANRRSIEVQYQEPDNGSNWNPFPGTWRIEEAPDDWDIEDGRSVNKKGGFYLIFGEPQCYRNTSLGDKSAYVGFRNFRVTFAHKILTNRQSRGFGRVSSDSGRRGDFPIERKRLALVPGYKYIYRKSFRETHQVTRSGETWDISEGTGVIRDDSLRLRELVRNLADRNSKPTGAFKIQIKGKNAPDFSFKRGQQIVTIENSDGLEEVALDIVAISFDFTNARTLIVTEDVMAAEELEVLR